MAALGGQGGSGANTPAEMAMGFAMAQQLAQGMNQPQTTPAAGNAPPPLPGTPAPAAVPAPAATPSADILTPAQVAQTLGVTEQDVIASIDAGDLKGKKIGTQYRITKAALDEFLAH